MVLFPIERCLIFGFGETFAIFLKPCCPSILLFATCRDFTSDKDCAEYRVGQTTVKFRVVTFDKPAKNAMAVFFLNGTPQAWKCVRLGQ